MCIRDSFVAARDAAAAGHPCRAGDTGLHPGSVRRMSGLLHGLDVYKRQEKGCAVREALAEGKLSQTRYDSYCAMYDEVKDGEA